MAKTLIIHKNMDKIEIRKNGELIADIIIASSSRTASVNLAIKADMDIEIKRVNP